MRRRSPRPDDRAATSRAAPRKAKTSRSSIQGQDQHSLAALRHTGVNDDNKQGPTAKTQDVRHCRGCSLVTQTLVASRCICQREVQAPRVDLRGTLPSIGLDLLIPLAPAGGRQQPWRGSVPHSETCPACAAWPRRRTRATPPATSCRKPHRHCRRSALTSRPS